ncbi:MAG: hypothetical protein AAGC85_12655 [Bacteroidota bacterium]
MKKWIFVLVGCCCLISCVDNDKPSPNGVELRLLNGSDVPFDEVLVRIGEKEERFAGLDTGAVTEYVSFDFLYRYAYTQVIIGEDTAIIQPIDFVGERKYTSGRFTYKLFFTDFLAEEEYLDIEFIPE